MQYKVHQFYIVPDEVREIVDKWVIQTVDVRRQTAEGKECEFRANVYRTRRQIMPLDGVFSASIRWIIGFCHLRRVGGENSIQRRDGRFSRDKNP